MCADKLRHGKCRSPRGPGMWLKGTLCSTCLVPKAPYTYLGLDRSYGSRLGFRLPKNPRVSKTAPGRQESGLIPLKKSCMEVSSYGFGSPMIQTGMKLRLDDTPPDR